MSTQAEPLPSCPPWSTLTQESVEPHINILPSLSVLCLYEGYTWPWPLVAWPSSFLYVQLPVCLQKFLTAFHPCSYCPFLPAGLLHPASSPQPKGPILRRQLVSLFGNLVAAPPSPSAQSGLIEIRDDLQGTLGANRALTKHLSPPCPTILGQH